MSDEGPNVRRFKTSVSTPSAVGERRANLVTAHRLVAAWAVALAVMVTVLVSILVAIAIEDVSWSSALPFLVCAVFSVIAIGTLLASVRRWGYPLNPGMSGPSHGSVWAEHPGTPQGR